MSFIWPAFLFSLLLLPVVLLLYRHLRRRRAADARALGPLSRPVTAAGRPSSRRRQLPLLFFFVGLAGLLFSLARPEMSVRVPQIRGTVILAFDVSNSMAADDLEPTRLQAAKVAARAFVEQQPPTIDIGVVAFSGGGVVVQPPTNDQAAVLAAIDRLTLQGGTSLGQGLFTALNAIAGEPISFDLDAVAETGQLPEIGTYPGSVILLLSDGEQTDAGDPLLVAQLAANAGVRVYPIGVGSREGRVLEIEGYNIVTQLDESGLNAIAGLTNGQYFLADDADALADIYDNIDLQLTIEGEKMEVTALAAGISALFFLIGGLLSLFWLGRVP